MTTVYDILVKMGFDASGFAEGAGQAQSHISELEKSAQRLDAVGDRMMKAGKGFSVAFTVPLALAGKFAISAAGDLEQSANAVEVVFGRAKDTILDFSKTSSLSVGLATTDFQQLSAEAGALLLNLGQDVDTAAESTINLSKRASDMAAVYNTDVSTAMEAIQSGLRGMGRPLTAFGVNLTESTVKAKALEMGLIGVGEEMDSASEATARVAVIMEQTDRIAGHFAAEGETLDGQLKRLKAQVKDLGSELGAYLLPALVDLVKMARNVVEWFMAMEPAGQQAVLVFAGIAASIGPVLLAGGQLIKVYADLIVVMPKVTAVVGALNVETIALAGSVALASGVILAAVSALVLLGINAKNTRIELDAQVKSVRASSESYENYVDKTVSAMEKQGWVLTENGQFQHAYTREIEKTVQVMSKADWVMNRLAEDTGYYSDMAAIAAQKSNELVPTLQDLVDKQRAYNAEVAQVQGLSENFSGIVSYALSYDKILGEMNVKQERVNLLMDAFADGDAWVKIDGVWVSASKAAEEVEGLTGDIGAMQEAMSKMANQAVLDMLMATISIDGVMASEAEAYFQMAADMGIISQEAADEAMRVYGEAVEYVNGLEIDDKNAIFTVDIRTTGGLGIPMDVTYAPPPVVKKIIYYEKLAKETGFEMQASGGDVFASQPYWVGERGAEPFFPETGGRILSHGEAIGAMASGGSNDMLEMLIGKIADKDDIARAVRDAVVVAMGG